MGVGRPLARDVEHDGADDGGGDDHDGDGRGEGAQAEALLDVAQVAAGQAQEHQEREQHRPEEQPALRVAAALPVQLELAVHLVVGLVEPVEPIDAERDEDQADSRPRPPRLADLPVQDHGSAYAEESGRRFGAWAQCPPDPWCVPLAAFSKPRQRSKVVQDLKGQ
jgi:hypothetical protein